MGFREKAKEKTMNAVVWVGYKTRMIQDYEGEEAEKFLGNLGMSTLEIEELKEKMGTTDWENGNY